MNANLIDEILSGKMKAASVSLWTLYFDGIKHIFSALLCWLYLFAVIFAVVFRFAADRCGTAYRNVTAWSAEREA